MLQHPDIRERISIHAPREGSDEAVLRGLELYAISIHAPREGSDDGQHHRRVKGRIPIHAPREGSDVIHQVLLDFSGDFNPRSP